MGLYLDGQIEIARGSAHGSCVSFAGNTNAPTVCDSGGNADIDRFVVANASFAAAGLARRAQLARSAATRAGNIEAHFASLLLNRARAVASWAGLRATDGSGSVARLAGIKARDLDFLYRAADRFPKIDFDAV